MSPIYVPDATATDGIAEVDLLAMREQIARRIFPLLAGQHASALSWDGDDGRGRNLAYSCASAAIVTICGPAARADGGRS